MLLAFTRLLNPAAAQSREVMAKAMAAPTKTKEVHKAPDQPRVKVVHRDRVVIRRSPGAQTSTISSPPPNYVSTTSFAKSTIGYPLHTAPNVNSSIIERCPKNATVYVLDFVDESFAKVWVNGKTGFVTRGLLE